MPPGGVNTFTVSRPPRKAGGDWSALVRLVPWRRAGSVTLEFAEPVSVSDVYHASVFGVDSPKVVSFRLDEHPGPHGTFQVNAKGGGLPAPPELHVGDICVGAKFAVTRRSPAYFGATVEPATWKAFHHMTVHFKAAGTLRLNVTRTSHAALTAAGRKVGGDYTLEFQLGTDSDKGRFAFNAKVLTQTGEPVPSIRDLVDPASVSIACRSRPKAPPPPPHPPWPPWPPHPRTAAAPPSDLPPPPPRVVYSKAAPNAAAPVKAAPPPSPTPSPTAGASKVAPPTAAAPAAALPYASTQATPTSAPPVSIAGRPRRPFLAAKFNAAARKPGEPRRIPSPTDAAAAKPNAVGAAKGLQATLVYGGFATWVFVIGCAALVCCLIRKGSSRKDTLTKVLVEVEPGGEDDFEPQLPSTSTRCVDLSAVDSGQQLLARLHELASPAPSRTSSQWYERPMRVTYRDSYGRRVSLTEETDMWEWRRAHELHVRMGLAPGTVADDPPTPRIGEGVSTRPTPTWDEASDATDDDDDIYDVGAPIAQARAGGEAPRNGSSVGGEKSGLSTDEVPHLHMTLLTAHFPAGSSLSAH